MNKLDQIKFLIDVLLTEMPQLKEQTAQVSKDLNSQRQLLRALMNVRPPMPLKASFLTIQDDLLRNETKEKGIVRLDDVPKMTKNIGLWQGDITRLKVGAIVNAANSALLGCFAPCHGCIDNAIHSAAGLQLRDACAKIMEEQGHDEPTGQAKITPAFNLPSKFVIHTVGPIIASNCEPSTLQKVQLANCYTSCLELAVENNLDSIAFCCISTGEFNFPNQLAAEIAVDTVNKFFSCHKNSIDVVFNTFKDIDTEIYKKLFNKT